MYHGGGREREGRGRHWLRLDSNFSWNGIVFIFPGLLIGTAANVSIFESYRLCKVHGDGVNNKVPHTALKSWDISEWGGLEFRRSTSNKELFHFDGLFLCQVLHMSSVFINLNSEDSSGSFYVDRMFSPIMEHIWLGFDDNFPHRPCPRGEMHLQTALVEEYGIISLCSLSPFSPGWCECPSTSQENDPRLVPGTEGQVDFRSDINGHSSKLYKTRLGETNCVNILQ